MRYRILCRLKALRILIASCFRPHALPLQVSKGDQYPTLLKALIVQSMIKIEEDAITVICREADIEAVKSVVDVSACLAACRGGGCGC